MLLFLMRNPSRSILTLSAYLLAGRTPQHPSRRSIGQFASALPFSVRFGNKDQQANATTSSSSTRTEATASEFLKGGNQARCASNDTQVPGVVDSVMAEDGTVVSLDGIQSSLSSCLQKTTLDPPTTATRRADDTKPKHQNPVVESYFQNSNIQPQDTATLVEELRVQSQRFVPFLQETRRTLHLFPELMYQEAQTSSILQTALTALNITYSTGWAVNTKPQAYNGPGGYGLVADIGTGKPPCVLLRADMDALPMTEHTKYPSEDPRQPSLTKGRMHGCGHDAHMTMLLGAAAVLKQMEDSLAGTVRIMFQPAEEGGAGAKRMVEEGVLRKEPKVENAFAMHVWPTLPSGTIGARQGPLLASYNRFTITLTGVGGHAAFPHQTIDVIPATASLISSLQTLVSRRLHPLDPGVVSVTQIQAGEESFNVIPPKAVLRGTLRALKKETMEELKSGLHAMVENIAQAHQCQYEVEYTADEVPPTINAASIYPFATEVAADVAVDKRVAEVEPTMGAEDFAFVANSVPSVFLLLGQGSGVEPPTRFGLHHPEFAVDEEVLGKGVELHVNLAVRSLYRLGREMEMEG